MEATFYPEVAARQDAALVVPGETDRSWIHDRYVGELLKGEFRDETRTQFTSLVSRLREEQDIDAVILGGTELPLLLPEAEIGGVPALDTTALHVDAILQRLRG
jgi:aspartate racemase